MLNEIVILGLLKHVSYVIKNPKTLLSYGYATIMPPFSELSQLLRSAQVLVNPYIKLSIYKPKQG